MNSDLTIVVPTRGRVDWLASCLRSIFEYQTTAVPVIVSDNSVSQHSAVAALKRSYDFTYVRQSGLMSMTDHFNACFDLVSTPWVNLLHDDDELCQDVLEKLTGFLAQHGDVGIVVGGYQYIDPKGKIRGAEIPDFGVFRGEEGLLSIGLEFRAKFSNTIFNVTKSRAMGGFPDARGHAMDYPFACGLAHSYGVAFLPEVIGRYRMGHEQSSSVSDHSYVEALFGTWLPRTAELLRELGCTAGTAERLMDAHTWAIFEWVASYWMDSDPKFVFALYEKCLSLSPKAGPWQSDVRSKYPLLFLRPPWLARRLFNLVGPAWYRPSSLRNSSLSAGQ